VITLTLLHPLNKDVPVQSWSFERDQLVRIGRSTDNQVVLYSAVVSRHHVEIRRLNNKWEVVNLGTNGTYLEGKRITQVQVIDGLIIRLARSGPYIQIRLGPAAIKDALSLSADRTVTEQISAPPTARPTEEFLPQPQAIPVPQHMRLPPLI